MKTSLATSSYGVLLDRVVGERGKTFVYANLDGGFTVRHPGDHLVNVSTREAAMKLARRFSRAEVVCERCGSTHKADQSCGCFDNHSE
jgi:hypothetical protein